MDNYNNILAKYIKYIIDNNINKYEKIEKMIKSDKDYSSLDIMEEDALKDELTKKIKLKKTKTNITIKTNTFFNIKLNVGSYLFSPNTAPQSDAVILLFLISNHSFERCSGKTICLNLLNISTLVLYSVSVIG